MGVNLLGRSSSLLLVVVVANLVAPRKPRVPVSFVAKLAILLVNAETSLLALTASSVARGVTRLTHALVTSLVPQQMLLQLLPKRQLLTPSPRSLGRGAPRASAMVTAR